MSCLLFRLKVTGLNVRRTPADVPEIRSLETCILSSRNASRGYTQIYWQYPFNFVINSSVDEFSELDLCTYNRNFNVNCYNSANQSIKIQHKVEIINLTYGKVLLSNKI